MSIALPLDDNSHPVPIFAIVGDPIMTVSADGSATDAVELPEGYYLISGTAVGYVLFGAADVGEPTSTNCHLFIAQAGQILRVLNPRTFVRVAGPSDVTISFCPVG